MTASWIWFDWEVASKGGSEPKTSTVAPSRAAASSTPSETALVYVLPRTGWKSATRTGEATSWVGSSSVAATASVGACSTAVGAASSSAAGVAAWHAAAAIPRRARLIKDNQNLGLNMEFLLRLLLTGSRLRFLNCPAYACRGSTGRQYAPASSSNCTCFRATSFQSVCRRPTAEATPGVMQCGRTRSARLRE